MHLEWNWKTMLIVAATVLLFVGTNFGQYYAIWKPKQEKLTADYDSQIAVLQHKLEQIGPMVNIWAIKDGAGLFPGKEIVDGDLEMRQIPESLLLPSFVLEPSTVVGKYFRVKLESGTPLSIDLVMETPVDKTSREYDVVADVLPIGLRVGDYIDFRIVYPLGEDYIVLPHKRVEAINQKTIKMTLSESEIHFYQAALIDSFLNSDKGAMLYMTKYIEPGIQEPAKMYYAIPKNIQAIMLADPNLASDLLDPKNDKIRSVIDTGNLAVTDEIASKINAGRGKITGKIDVGAEALNQQLQEIKDALATAEPAAEPAPDTSTTAGVTPEGQQSLNIEEGVVE